MSRRRLRIHYSSSSEDDNPHPPSPPPPHPRQSPREEEDIEIDLQEDFQSVTLNPPIPNPVPPLSPDEDEEFLDVSDNLSPPPMMAHSSFGTSGTSSYFERSGCPIGGFLEGLGLRLRGDWVDSCVRGLEGSVPGFGGLDVAAKAKLCFEQFLVSDMNCSGAGILPGNVQGLHLVDLPGPFVLQVDEIVNTSCPLKGRYQAANPGLKRCLKLSMTDGVQRLFGMEYRPIKALEVLAPAGLKIVLRNVHVRRGILMLVPEVVEVLGGLVEDLEAARQRLVQEVNKPPRGKRTRNGVVPPLATRATQSAWPPNGFNGQGPTNVTTSQSAAPPPAAGPGPTSVSTSQSSAPPRPPEPASTPRVFNHERNTQEFASRDNSANLRPNISPPVGNRRASLESNISPPVVNRRASFEPNISSGVENSRDNFDSTLSSTIENRRTSVESNISSTAGNSSTNFEPHLLFTTGSTMASVETNISSNVEPNLPSSATPNVEDIHMTDEVDHPSILSGEREFPFTYIASLSAKLAAVNGKASCVQGTIKCFLTGVKGFQFRHREKYELRAYVDDGSLISEILIDHNLVQKRVGYSPQEVTASLSDKKRVNQMKETLTQFQYFLANFEGTMLVQLSEASPFPMAIEMNQGCSTSVAWSLLRRLKSFNANQPQRLPCIEPIDLSP